MPPEENDTTIVEQEAPAPPEWVEEQFRSNDNPVEAQARSYAEARRELNRIQTERDRERREFSEALQTFSEQQQTFQQQQAYPQQQADPLLSAAQRAYEEGDVTTLLAIQAQISQAATAQILDQRLGQFDERFNQSTSQDRELSLRLAEEQVQRVFGEERWQELAPKVQDALAASPLPPSPSVEGYAAHLLQVAKVVDYDRLTAANRTLEEERTAKLNAQTLGNGSNRAGLQAPQDKDGWEAIKNADSGGWSSIINGGG